MIVAQSKDGRRVFVLDYIFDGGAVGAEYRQMTEAEFDDRTSWDAMVEFAEPIWREDASMQNGTTESLDAWALQNYDDILNAIVCDWQELPGRYYVAEPIGVGRIFYEGWHNGLEITDLEAFTDIETAEGR